MMLPRFLHRWYAKAFGYFWLPCPICGRDFGGHERKHQFHTLWRGDGTGASTCPRCPVEYRPTSEGLLILTPTKTDHVLAPSLLKRKQGA